MLRAAGRVDEISRARLWSDHLISVPVRYQGHFVKCGWAVAGRGGAVTENRERQIRTVRVALSASAERWQIELGRVRVCECLCARLSRQLGRARGNLHAGGTQNVHDYF